MVFAPGPVWGPGWRGWSAGRPEAMPGVQRVIEIHPMDNPTHLVAGIAVIADNTWAAFKGRDALDVHWNESPHRIESSDRAG